MATSSKKSATFMDVHRCLEKHGPATVKSRRGITYKVWAERRKDEPAIVGYPRAGEVAIHSDCWGSDITCAGTRAGGIFNGTPSIYDWYLATCVGK
jgi:hypothetical protein